MRGCYIFNTRLGKLCLKSATTFITKKLTDGCKYSPAETLKGIKQMVLSTIYCFIRRLPEGNYIIRYLHNRATLSLGCDILVWITLQDYEFLNENKYFFQL